VLAFYHPGYAEYEARRPLNALADSKTPVPPNQMSSLEMTARNDGSAKRDAAVTCQFPRLPPSANIPGTNNPRP